MLQGNQLGVRKVIEAVRSVRKQETQVVLWGFSAARLQPVESLILPSFTQVTNPSSCAQALGSHQKLSVFVTIAGSSPYFERKINCFLPLKLLPAEADCTH